MQHSSGSHSHDNCVQTQLCAQLEFVQILVIMVVMMVMVVVITCLLNHYRLSARSLLSRHAPTRRRHLPLANEGSLWSAEGTGTSGGLMHQVYNPRAPDRGVPSSYLQREPQHAQPQAQPPLQSQRFQHTYAPSRFQPTYPYLPQSLIDLPPTISLSDGEEPPPYQGPCTLQLRDPEQQMELNRESVRPPPNRTVFDSHPLDPSNSCLQASLVLSWLLCSQSAGPSSERPSRHQRVRSPGGLSPAAQAGLPSRRSSPGLQRGNRALLPPDVPDPPQPQPSDSLTLTATPVLADTRPAQASTTAVRKRGQQERKKYKGEIPEAPAVKEFCVVGAETQAERRGTTRGQRSAQQCHENISWEGSDLEKRENEAELVTPNIPSVVHYSGRKPGRLKGPKRVKH
ncbi:hypothetical protein PAMP_016904 [Pampus punctatissimus]